MNKLHIMEILQILVKPLHETSLEKDLNERNISATVKCYELNLNFLPQLEINHSDTNINEHTIYKYLLTNMKLIQLLISEINTEIKEFSNSNLKTCSPDILNLNQEKLINLSLNLSFSLAIQPLLSEGTTTESDSIKSLKDKFRTEKIVFSWKNLQNDQKSLVLKNCCLFFNILLSNENPIEYLKNILISKHLNYLLALYLEVIYSPSISDYLRTNFNFDYIAINSNLNKICHSLNQCNIMREIVILQTVKPVSKDTKISPPKWFKKSCLVILKELIMNEFGLKALILALMPQCLGDETQGQLVSNDIKINWKWINSLARIAADLPTDDKLKDYYKDISKQIITILNINDYKKFKINQKDKLLINVSIQVISIIYSKDARLIEELIISKIFQPFETAIKFNEKKLTMIDELTMCNFVTFLDQVFIPNMEPNSPLIKTFNKYLDYFFKLYLFSQTSISYIKSIVENIILWIFNLLSPKDITNYFLSCFFSQSLNQLDYIKENKKRLTYFEMENIIFMDTNFKLVNTSSGLIEMILEDSIEINSNYYRSNWVIDILLNFISSLKTKNDVAIDFIIILLEKLTIIVNNDIKEYYKDVNIKINSFEHFSKDFENKLFLFNLLAGLSEKFEETTTENRSKIIDLAKLNLERGVSILNSTSEELTGIFVSETLTLAMGLLSAIFADRNLIKEEDWIKAESLLPLLSQLSEKHELDEIKKMAFDLKIALATHGIFKQGKKSQFNCIKTNNIERDKCSETIITDIDFSKNIIDDSSHLPKNNKSSRSFCKPNDNICGKTKTVLIEEIDSVEFLNSIDNKIKIESTSDKLSDQDCIVKDIPDNEELLNTNKNGFYKSELFRTKEFKEILQLLSDPSIPARGHGLILLKRQIENCSQIDNTDIDSLYDVCKLNLLHEDSYIYLNAILVISALGNICPQAVIIRIAKEYRDGDETLKDEVKLKLGEVLVKIVDHLGEIVPKYSDILISSVLSCIKKNQGIVKASGVANLAQICHHLHFSFGTIIYEILDCIESLIKCEKHVETRRAAGHFITLLLRGLSKDVFQVLGDKLLDLYRLLKFCRLTDEDDIVKLHIQLSIQELDIIIKDWLTPSQSLEKHLYVLDYPSNNFTF